MQREEALQRAATAWLVKQRAYEENFEDARETTKARLDSVGLINGRTFLIEVKPILCPASVLHIQNKLSNGLIEFFDITNQHPLFLALRKIWDGLSIPLLAIIFEDPGSGLHDLIAKLTRHADEWDVDWEVLQWTGESLTLVVSGKTSALIRNPKKAIDVVTMPDYDRSPKATIEELRETAIGNRVIDLFDYAMEIGKQHGFKCGFKTSHVTLERPRGRGWMPIKPGSSTEAKGLLIGCPLEVVPLLPTHGLIYTDITLYNYIFYHVRQREVLDLVMRATDIAARMYAESGQR